jgi:hypothetical protein
MLATNTPANCTETENLQKKSFISSGRERKKSFEYIFFHEKKNSLQNGGAEAAFHFVYSHFLYSISV